MKLEHFALNVAKPLEMAAWYETNLGMTIVKKQTEAPYTHFIADQSGRIMIEIYCNPANEVPNYSTMNPLLVHLAFVSANPNSDKDRLVTAGATLVSDTVFEDGTQLIMLRDPWGLAIQLCKRAVSMLCEKEN